MTTSHRLTTNIVPPDGPLDARLLFIGEAPGEEEDYRLKPFVGAAGRLLNSCLRQAGIARSEVLVTNIFKQRPPRNRIGYYFQDRSCTKPTWEGEEHIEQLRQWLGILLEQRERTGLGPNIIVALGATAMKILTGKRRIKKWRGSVLPCTLVEGFKVYPIFHPSYVMRLMQEPRESGLYGAVVKKDRENALPIFLKDLVRAEEQSDFPEIRRPQRSFALTLDFADIKARIRALDHEKLVAVDIETLPAEGGPIVWMIGFAASPNDAFVVPILSDMKMKWTIDEEHELWRLISEFFLNPNVNKVFQGGTYDLSVLGRNYGLRVANTTYHDTMFCHQATYPHIRKALEVLASLYTWEPYYKDEGKVHAGKRASDYAEAQYNAKDCCITREIFPILRRKSMEKKTWAGYLRTMSCMPSILGMMGKGIRINLDLKEQLSKDFHSKIVFHTNSLADLTGQQVNINSPKQLQRLLYGYYDFPIQYNHKTKKPTTDADALNKLHQTVSEGSEQYQVIDHILKVRKYSKLHSTYTEMQVGSDGRIYTSYGVTSTWRLRSSESPFGVGGNLQNIPVRSEEGKMIRKLFIPDEGMVFIASDLAKAEAMVVAWEAEDIKAIEDFLNGVDCHWENAKTLFGIPTDTKYEPQTQFTDPITKTPHTHYFYRRIGKTVVHAGNYGMGPRMLQTILAREGIIFDFSVCRMLLATFRTKKPFTVEWQRRIRETIRATRTLISSYGRKREFLGRINDDLFRVCYAFSPQNTVGEILVTGIQKIWDTVPQFLPLLNIHDEVLGQCYEDDIPQVVKGIRAALEQPLKIHGRTLTIPTEFKWGSSWGDLEEVDW